MTRFLPKAFATDSLIKTVFASVKKHNHVTFTEIEIKITKGPSRHTKYGMLFILVMEAWRQVLNFSISMKAVLIYTHLKNYKEHLINFALLQLSNQITWQLFNTFMGVLVKTIS